MLYRFADCELNEQLYQLRRCGEVVPLEPQVFRLLAYLLTHRDRVVSRDELFEQLWPGQVVGDAALTYCVAKARKAVDDSGTAQRIIKTMHGHGYHLIAQVVVTEACVTTSASEIRATAERRQEHILSPSHTPSLPIRAFPERTPVTWPLLSSSRQSRQLTLVGCLFVCGWATSLWQISVRSPWNLQSVRTPAYYARSDVTPPEDMPCQWWAQSTLHPPAREALLHGWTAANRLSPGAQTEARWLFQRAIDLDPTYAAAYASLGVLAWHDWLSWSPDPQSLDHAALYLQKAAALDSSCPQVVTLLSQVLLVQRRQAQAVTEAERQLRPAPLPFSAASAPALPPHFCEINVRQGSHAPSDTVQ